VRKEERDTIRKELAQLRETVPTMEHSVSGKLERKMAGFIAGF
jgi:hypothetical protein